MTYRINGQFHESVRYVYFFRVPRQAAGRASRVLWGPAPAAVNRSSRGRAVRPVWPSGLGVDRTPVGRG